MQRACSTLTHYCGSSTRWQLPGDAGKYRTIAVEIGPAHTPSLTSPSRPSSEQRGAARRVSARTANGSKPAKGCSARSRGRFRRRTDAAAKNPDAKIETLLPEGLPRRGCRSERSAQAYAEGGSRSRVPSNGEGPETPDRQSACANVGTEALAFRVEAFSFREPGPLRWKTLEGRLRRSAPACSPPQFPASSTYSVESVLKPAHRALRIRHPKRHCSAPRSNRYKSRRNRGVTFACRIS
jgi:hypothetical protein